LGIDKEMSKLFQEYKKEDLNLLEASEYFTCPYIQRRKENQFYCKIFVSACSHEFYWYKNLIGYTFFCRLYFGFYPDGSKYIRECKGIRLTNKKEIIFRGFDPKDIFIC